MNSVNLFGRLGHEIILQTTANNSPMVKFQLAVTEGKHTDCPRRTDLIPCVAWGSRAELIAKYVCKGDQMIISGRLRINKFIDKNNINRKDMQVEVIRISFVAGNKTAFLDKEQGEEN